MIEAGNVDSVHEGETQSINSLYRVKVAETAFFIAAWISLGLMSNINNPTIPDLRERLDVSMEDISLALAFRALGIPIGCVVGGMIADRYRAKSDLIGSTAMMLGGVSVLAIPFMPRLGGIGVVSFTGGLGHGAVDAVGNGVVQWMWAEKSGIPMHSVHLGYPIGATLAPVIAQPFLSSENRTDYPTTTPSVDAISRSISVYEYSVHCNKSAGAWSNGNINSRIEIPFSIIGGFALLLALITLLFFVAVCSTQLYAKLYGRSKQSMKEVFSPQGFRSLGDTKYTVVLLVLICIFFAFLASKDSTMDTFIFSYAVDSELQFSKDEAAALSAAYNAAGIFGRLVCIILARWCATEPILIFSTVATTVFSGCIAFLGTEKDIYIWTFALLFKVTATPVWPSAILWACKYVRFSSVVAGFIQISASLATFASQWASGYLYDTYGPEAHVYFGMACGVMMVVILLAMQLIGGCCKEQQNADMTQAVGNIDDKTYGSTIVLNTELSTRL